MLELLVKELGEVGLALNTNKTKICTTEQLQVPMYIEVAGGMVEVLTGDYFHKYLGRHIPGDLAKRGSIEFSHRVAAAWGKFHKHRQCLTNQHVHVKLRLKLFEAVVTPTVMFGLTTIPVTAGQLQQLDAVRRRMLRSIVGWIRSPGEDWADTMRTMNGGLQRANDEYPTQAWSQQFASRQFSLADRLARRSDTCPAKAASWDPFKSEGLEGNQCPYRSVGRPRAKWDDWLKKFSKQAFNSDQWYNVEQQDWLAKGQDYLNMFM